MITLNQSQLSHVQILYYYKDQLQQCKGSAEFLQTQQEELQQIEGDLGIFKCH